MDSSRVSSARIDTRTDERTDGRTEREATCHRPRIFRCIASPFSAYLNDTIVLYERSDIEVGERKALCLASCLRACIPSPCSASPLPAFCLQSARSRSLRSSLFLSPLSSFALPPPSFAIPRSRSDFTQRDRARVSSPLPDPFSSRFQKDLDPRSSSLDRERIGKDSIFVQRWSERSWRREGRGAWRAGNVGGEEEQAGNINHLESIRHEGSRADDLAVPCCQVHGAPIVSGRPDGSANYQHSGALSSERDLRRV